MMRRPMSVAEYRENYPDLPPHMFRMLYVDPEVAVSARKAAKRANQPRLPMWRAVDVRMVPVDNLDRLSCPFPGGYAMVALERLIPGNDWAVSAHDYDDGLMRRTGEEDSAREVFALVTSTTLVGSDLEKLGLHPE